MTTTESLPPRRTRRQIRLRTLFVLVFLFALPLGFWAAYIQPHRREARLLAQLRERGFEVTTAQAEGPVWFWRLLGRDFGGYVTEVRIGDPKIKRDDLAILAEAPRLKSLGVSNYRLGDDEGLHQIGRLTQLQHLAVIGDFTDTGMSRLARLDDLRTLELSDPSWTGEGLRRLGKLKQLRVLAMQSPGKFHDAANWAGLRELHTVTLRAWQVTDDGLRHLAHLPRLQRLHLIHCRGLTEEGLRRLGQRKQLTSLHLVFCDDLTDEGLRGLAELTQLQELSLVCDYAESSFGDTGLKHLAGLRELRRIILYSPQVTDEGLRILQQLPELAELRLGMRFPGEAVPARMMRWSDSVWPLESHYVAAALKRPAMFQCTDASLEEVAELLSRRSRHLNIRVRVDRSELERAGGFPEKPISVDFGDEASLREALDAILGPLQLDWVIADGELRITTKEAAEKSGCTALFKKNPQINIIGANSMADFPANYFIGDPSTLRLLDNRPAE